jgi:hypothetical protein
LVLEKKNPQATERRSPAGVPRLIIDAAANGSGGVFLLCIPSGCDLGTPGFQDNRVCRFHFSLRLEKIGENSWWQATHLTWEIENQQFAEGYHEFLFPRQPSRLRR